MRPSGGLVRTSGASQGSRGKRRPGGHSTTVAALIESKHAQLVARHPTLRAAVSQSPAPAVPTDPMAVVLGRDDRGEPLLLPERPRLEHMHIIGATGSGKTNLLEHCIRQDVIHGRGVCVVDPHGNHPDSLYRSLLGWLDRNGFTKSRVIHLIDPNAHSHAIGFNPLGRLDANTSYSVIAEAMFEAFERMWGDEDGNTKPTIQRVLTATFTALGEQQLTLAEARLLLDPDDSHGIRALVLQKLHDDYAHDEIEYLHRIGEERTGRRDFRAEVIGPINRIAKLVRNEAVRAIVGQTERVLDLREAMDEGHIILANLSGGPMVYEQGADLLGRLLTRFLFFHARRRRNPEYPFFVYLDEAHRYLSGDLPNIFAEIRKYGVGVTASHQWLAQTGSHDDPIREAICNGPNIKIVFRVRNPREAIELAESVIPLDLEMPVRALVKPTVIGHRRTLLRNASSGSNYSQNRSHGQTEATNTSTTHTDGVTRGVTDSTAQSITKSKSHSITHSESDTTGESVTESVSHSSGTSRTISEGEATARGSSSGSSRDRSTTSTADMVPVPKTTTSGSGTSSGSDRSQSHSRGDSRGTSEVETVGSAVTHSTAHTVGRSEGHTTGRAISDTVGQARSTTESQSAAQSSGRSVGTSLTEGTSTGTSDSTGVTESFEPIYRDLPTAVHGKDNVLYVAAQELLSLPTGAARVAYVGTTGRYFARLKVPLVAHADISDQEFQALRSRMLQQSAVATPFRDALQHIESRETRLIEEAAELNKPPPAPDEPKTFRLPAPKSAKGNAKP